MNHIRTNSLSIFAPAKINLYLHVTGRLGNGYHTLDSLIGFVDIGDEITLCPAEDFSFSIEGLFGAPLSADDSNLVVKAAHAMAQATNLPLNMQITLTKNLPIASGIGGGSSDAAAMVRGLCAWWDIPISSDSIPALLKQLGADVPVCFDPKPTRLRGIGEILDPAPALSTTPIVLVNPGKSCSTPDVFKARDATYKDDIDLPSSLEDFDDLIAFLGVQDNDLYEPACRFVPEINEVLHALNEQTACAFSRLSGSGATCFGLFKNKIDAQNAARSIAQTHPDWWVKSGILSS